MDATDTGTEVTDVTPEIPPDIKLLIAMRGKGYAGVSELAKHLDMNLPTLSRILRGYRYQETLSNLRNIAAALGMTLDELDKLILDMRAKGRYLALVPDWRHILRSALLPTPDRTIDLTGTD